MNSKRYSELLNKYDEGLTTGEEERWMKDNVHLAPGPLPAALFKEAAPIMNWSFDEFLVQARQQEDLPATAKLRSFAWIKYAAAIIVITLLAITFFYNKKDAGPAKNNLLVNEVIEPVENNSTASTDTASKIKPVPVVNSAAVHPGKIKKKLLINKKPSVATPENDDFFVIVNGRRITDENEALAILQQSLHNLSGDMRETMADINHSPKLDVKFK